MSPASRRKVTPRKLLPLRPAGLIGDLRAALYAGVILAGVIVVASGLAIWKPVQLRELTSLFGGYDVARYVHFFTMAAIVVFLVIHIAMAIIVPKSLRAMILGS